MDEHVSEGIHLYFPNLFTQQVVPVRPLYADLSRLLSLVGVLEEGIPTLPTQSRCPNAGTECDGQCWTAKV